ncbi:MAG: hypothetical protein AAF570_04095 [Bacteroidota bacterium]
MSNKSPVVHLEVGLKLVETAWTGAEPQQAWMSQVEGEELVAILGFLLDCGKPDQDWIWAALSGFPEAFGQMALQKDVMSEAKEWLKRFVPGDWSEISELLAGHLVLSGDFSGLRNGQRNWGNDLTALMRREVVESANYEAILTTLKQAKGPISYILKAFMVPDLEIPAHFNVEDSLRKNYLRMLHFAHGMKKGALRKMGFSKAEVEAADIGGGGVFRMLKGLFGG